MASGDADVSPLGGGLVDRYFPSHNSRPRVEPPGARRVLGLLVNRYYAVAIVGGGVKAGELEAPLAVRSGRGLTTLLASHEGLQDDHLVRDAASPWRPVYQGPPHDSILVSRPEGTQRDQSGQ